MSTDEATPLGAAVGARLRALRAEKPWMPRQEDVARRMREAVGFGNWTRATVAAVETGKRDVSMEELVGLTYACAVPISDWFAGEGLVALSPLGVVTHRGLRRMFGSDEPGDPRMDWYIPDVVTNYEPMRQRRQAWAQEHEAEIVEVLATGLLRGVWPDHTPVKDAEQAFLDAEGDAEQKAADSLARRGLDIQPLGVSLVAHALWGHGLTAEREDRAAKRTGKGASARSVQAARGHVTRGLLNEIAEVLAPEGEGE